MERECFQVHHGNGGRPVGIGILCMCGWVHGHENADAQHKTTHRKHAGHKWRSSFDSFHQEGDEDDHPSDFEHTVDARDKDRLVASPNCSEDL